MHFLHKFIGSNASARNCVDLITSVKNVSKHLDDISGSDLHVPPDTGLAVYAFTTPFILIIGNHMLHDPLNKQI